MEEFEFSVVHVGEFTSQGQPTVTTKWNPEPPSRTQNQPMKSSKGSQSKSRYTEEQNLWFVAVVMCFEMDFSRRRTGLQTYLLMQVPGKLKLNDEGLRFKNMKNLLSRCASGPFPEDNQ